MAGTSPTARSLARLRKEGWTAQVVERWNSFARVRQDLFGFIDIVAIRPGRIMGVQSTTFDNRLARVKKMKALPALGQWLAAGGEVVVHGWKKVGARWELVEEVLCGDGVAGRDLGPTGEPAGVRLRDRAGRPEAVHPPACCDVCGRPVNYGHAEGYACFSGAVS